MNYDIIDLQKLEDQREPNQYFMCTKNGLYIIKIIEENEIIKFEIENGEMPDEYKAQPHGEPISLMGYLYDETVRAAV